MKGIVLLAVIHMLIIYQSQKNKVISNHSLPSSPGYVEKIPASEDNVLSKRDSVRIKNIVRPEYAIFQASRKGPVAGQAINF